MLYESGMAMHRIGALMGITRQRVAVLLNAAAEGKRESTAVNDSKVGEVPR